MTARTGLVLTLILALAGPAVAGPPAPLVQHVYPVADLVVPLNADGAKTTLEGQLMQLLRSTVAPRSWDGAGGPGTIQYFPLGMALVVHQTPARHEEIADLLAALRRLQDVQVATELRIVALPAALAENFARAVKLAEMPQPDGSRPTTAALDDEQLRGWLGIFQADRGTNIMAAPKMTLFSGQTGKLQVETKQTFVIDYRLDTDGAAIAPRHETVDLGFRADVTGTVSADRRFVRLSLTARSTSLKEPPVQVPVTLKVEKQGVEQVAYRFVEEVQVETLAARYAGVIPAGKTVVLPLGSTVRRTPGESLPVVGDLPVLGELLTELCGLNPAPTEERQAVFLFVTPRVLVTEDAGE